MGFSLKELNEFTVDEYIELSMIYAGESSPTKKATQKEIDSLLS